MYFYIFAVHHGEPDRPVSLAISMYALSFYTGWTRLIVSAFCVAISLLRCHLEILFVFVQIFVVVVVCLLSPLCYLLGELSHVTSLLLFLVAGCWLRMLACCWLQCLSRLSARIHLFSPFISSLISVHICKYSLPDRKLLLFTCSLSHSISFASSRLLLLEVPVRACYFIRSALSFLNVK